MISVAKILFMFLLLSLIVSEHVIVKCQKDKSSCNQELYEGTDY